MTKEEANLRMEILSRLISDEGEYIDEIAFPFFADALWITG